MRRGSFDGKCEPMPIGQLAAACHDVDECKPQMPFLVKRPTDGNDPEDILPLLSNGRTTGTASVKVQQCRAEDCAKLAFQNVQKAAVILGKYADDIENLEMAATHIKDSGLPKSFVDAVPKLDAVVAVVDQFADVSLCISPICSSS